MKDRIKKYFQKLFNQDIKITRTLLKKNKKILELS